MRKTITEEEKDCRIKIVDFGYCNKTSLNKTIRGYAYGYVEFSGKGIRAKYGGWLWRKRVDIENDERIFNGLSKRIHDKYASKSEGFDYGFLRELIRKVLKKAHAIRALEDKVKEA